MIRLFRTIATAARRRAEYHRTLRVLSGLNERELSDIGLTRCDIRRVARG